MAETARRNQLLPWFIGVGVIAAMDIVTGYLFFATSCRAPGIAQILVLIVMPVVYLVLMYMAFKSQP